MVGYKVMINKNMETGWGDCFEGFVRTEKEAEMVCWIVGKRCNPKIVKHEKPIIRKYVTITAENWEYKCAH